MVTIIGTDSVYPVMVHIQSYAFAEGRRTQDWRVGAGKTPVCHGRQGKTSRLRLKGLPRAAASQQTINTAPASSLLILRAPSTDVTRQVGQVGEPLTFWVF